MIGMAEILLPHYEEETYANSSAYSSDGHMLHPNSSSAVLDREQTMRFVKMMSCIMADQLKTVIMNSVIAYAEFWNEYTIERESRAYYAGDPIMQKRNYWY